MGHLISDRVYAGKWLGLALVAVIALTGCEEEDKPSSTAVPTESSLAAEIVFYDWAEDIPQTVIDAFTAEYQVQVTYLTYESTEEAVANIRARQVYDVIVMENHYVSALAAEGLLATIDHNHIPNFKNILPDFRDLVYDPGNVYSIPFNWGTTGLVVRSDLVEEPITRWADLWDSRYSGRIGLWNVEREVIGATLKSLGYSANSADPAQIEEARQRLLELAPQVRFLEDDVEISPAPLLISGDLVIAIGYAYDVIVGREEVPAISYVLPEEGALLWGDNFVVPANSPHKPTAELFLDFLLRPEIAAQIANANHYATANESALPLIDADLRNDPVIFPPNEDLARAEILLPLTSETAALYNDLWDEFVAAVEANKP